MIQHWKKGLIGAISLAACAQAAGDLQAEDPRQGGSFGHLSLTHKVDVATGSQDNPSNEISLEVNAVFVRYYDTTHSAVQTLLNIPGRPTQEGCWLMDDTTLTEEHPDAEIELLNAGPLLLQVGSDVRRVYPRTFPELGSLNTGAIYASEEHLHQGDSPIATSYILVAEGAADVAAFSVELEPQATLLIRGISEDSTLGGEIFLDRARDLEFTWEPDNPADTLFVDVLSGEKRLHCVTMEQGRARILASALLNLPPDDAAEIRVSRERRSNITIDGFDTADIVVRTEALPYVVRLY
ncbi:MAG: hypothetical protein H6714_00810 [Myxococcales bacterium]|nr:hypothetical protein [Myxococcales bacterium]